MHFTIFLTDMDGNTAGVTTIYKVAETSCFNNDNIYLYKYMHIVC